MKKTIIKLRKAILANLRIGLRDAKFKNLKSVESFVSQIEGMKSLFKVEDEIISAEFDLKKTNAITREDLTELSYIVSLLSEEEELNYTELVHFDYKDAVFLQIHYYFWFNDYSALIGEEKCLLMMVIYERLFGYDMQEVYDTLKSLYPEEDDIDDYSNSTMEVYDSSEFSDCDGEFHAFLYEMIF